MHSLLNDHFKDFDEGAENQTEVKMSKGFAHEKPKERYEITGAENELVEFMTVEMKSEQDRISPSPPRSSPPPSRLKDRSQNNTPLN